MKVIFIQISVFNSSQMSSRRMPLPARENADTNKSTIKAMEPGSHYNDVICQFLKLVATIPRVLGEDIEKRLLRERKRETRLDCFAYD